VFVLAMAALLGDHDPTVVLYYTQNFANSHYSALLGLFKGILNDSGRTTALTDAAASDFPLAKRWPPQLRSNALFATFSQQPWLPGS